MRKTSCILATVMALSFFGAFGAQSTPEAQIGKRLFFETRFAQAFFAQCNGNVNATVAGDPALAITVTAGSNLPGPLAAQTMSCRACHLDDELKNAAGGGMRSYSDFARRSPIPDRGDGKAITVRNAPSLVNASLSRANFLLHLDGEFASGAGLVQGTLTGRNFGWLPGEKATAIKHIARVIREDDGNGDLAKQFGGSYAKVFGGDSSVPDQFRLSGKQVLDVSKAKDVQIVSKIGELVAAFLNSLQFSTDSSGAFNGSPYDLFLIKNNLPRQPNSGESALDYARRLRSAIRALSNPAFVGSADGQFTMHSIPFVFGPDELAGLQLFLAEPSVPSPVPVPPTPPPLNEVGWVGNCFICHPPPAFTDFKFHNTGTSQLEYDAIFGDGAFAQLSIPTYMQRKKNSNCLPPSAAHPNNTGIFRGIPSIESPGRADLGLWSVYQNKDIPGPQKTLTRLLTAQFGKLKADAMLEKTIAVFKTPGLRDLLDSQPYLHNGSKDNLGDVVQFYVQISQLARANQIRNPDPELPKIALTPDQVQLVTKFLLSLTEDFSDEK